MRRISSRFITNCFTFHTLTSPDNIILVILQRSQKQTQRFKSLMDFKMYCFVCFILLVSLEGRSCNSPSITISPTTNTSENTEPTNFTSSNNIGDSQSHKQNTTANLSESPKTDSSKATKITKDTEGTKPKNSEPTHDGCLMNLKDWKDLLLGLIISLLCLICLLLLTIIMCMACKCCRGTRNNEVVMLKSSTSVRRNSVNGGPSETDVLLKDCSSVKVEMETIPAESEKPEEVGGADAEEVENQDTTEENKNAANDTSETAPTQEADQSAQTDLKTEALENAE